MSHPRRWSLGIKLALVGTPFLLIAFLIIAVTPWVSWQLEGGAAAVNEAGRMRMQAYRFSLPIGTSDLKALPAQRAEFERGLELLRDGNPERDWTRFRGQWVSAQSDSMEAHMSRWTALLHLLQVAMMTLAVIGTAVLLYTAYLFVLEPVGQLKEATERFRRGDFGARVQRITTDEFGTLAKGFNGKASLFKYISDDYPTNIGVISGVVGFAGGMGGFVLPIMFGAPMDLSGIRSSAFMLMYGMVWVSLIWMYWTEVRGAEVVGTKSKQFRLHG